MISTFARVLLGFVLACVTAGLVQVLFITPPQELLQIPAQAFPERAGQVGVLALLAATHTAIFSAAFTLIAAGIGEWMRIRSAAYYAVMGATIAALGFSAQYASEVAGQPTIFNPYALTAFLTSGVLAGLIYWLIAGRRAGGPEVDAEHISGGDSESEPTTPAIRTWKNRPRIIVEDPITPGSAAAKKATLAERLAEREEKAGEARTVAQQTADAVTAATTRPAGKPATEAKPPREDQTSAASGPKPSDAKPTDAKPADTKPASPKLDVTPVTSVPATKSVSVPRTPDTSSDDEQTRKTD